MPPELKTNISRYKELLKPGSYSEGVTEIQRLLPQLENFVRAHPNSTEGHLELAGAYIVITYTVANYLPPGTQKGRVLMEAVNRGYLKHGREALARFQELASPNDPRRRSVNQLLEWLDEIERKTSAR